MPLKITPFLLLFVLLFVACGSDPTQGLSNSATLPEKPTAVSTAIPTTIPTATATSPPPAETTLPAAETTAATNAATTSAHSGVPEKVWLPYGAGNYGEPILTIREGDPGYELPSTAVEIFFDYAPRHGLLAFGSEFWAPTQDGQATVTNLQVYDYAKQTTTTWLRGNVGRAAWSPAVGPQLALALYRNGKFDLVLMSEPEALQNVVPDIDPHFSWSPNGRAMAYVRGNTLFRYTPSAGEEQLATGLNRNLGWIGDEPAWSPDSTAVVYPDDPFRIVLLSERKDFTPTDRDGNPLQEQRPQAILLSNQLQQLIGQVDGQGGPSVQIYQLSDDYRTVLDTYFLDDTRLVGWYQPNESILVLDQDDTPRIWSLTAEAYQP